MTVITRATPRGLFGRIGLMEIHSSSVIALRALEGLTHDSGEPVSTVSVGRR
jgi:hypothetical protein